MNLPPEYRLLVKGEPLRKGDEYSYNNGATWFLVRGVRGKKYNPETYWPIRRRVTK